MSRIVIFFFTGKLKQNGVMIRDFFVVNHDKKITIHDTNLTNRVFFFR